MENIIYFVIAIVALVVLIYLEQSGRMIKRILPSGREFPKDSELLVLSKEQLMTDFSIEDLSRLADYAEKKYNSLRDEENKKKWDGVVRRINVARQDYIY